MYHRATCRNGSSWCDVAVPLLLAVLALPAQALVALPSSLMSSQALVSAGGDVGRWQLKLRTDYKRNHRAVSMPSLSNGMLLFSQKQRNFQLLPLSGRSSAGRRSLARPTVDWDSLGEHDRRSRMGAATDYSTSHFVCGGLFHSSIFSSRSTPRTSPVARERPRLSNDGGTNNQGEDGGSVEGANFGALPGKKENNADDGEDGRKSSDPDNGVGAEAAGGFKVEPVIELPVDGTLLQLVPVVLIGVLGVVLTGLVQLEASRFDAGIVGQGGGGGEDSIVVVEDLRQSDSK